MSLWWEKSDTITLLHGTSSAFVDRIESEGLVPPPHDLRSHALAIAEEHLGHAPRGKMRERVLEHAVLPRETASRQNPVAGTDRIYTYPAPNLDRAAGYAASFREHGGEVAACVWKVLTAEFGFSLAPLHAGADPVVVEFEIPRGDALCGRDLDDLARRVSELWEEERLTGDFATFEEFAADVAQFEVTVSRAVRPDEIRRVDVVPLGVDGRPDMTALNAARQGARPRI